MIEIRPVANQESDTFLRLLCDSFSLDFERAKSVFYHEPYFELKRKWALFESGQIISILTTVPLEFGFGNAFGIAGVATDYKYRNLGYAQKLIRFVLEDGARCGEPTAYLFASNLQVYSKLGFEVLDTVIQAPIETEIATIPGTILSLEAIREKYEAWMIQAPNRLLRDDRRWKYWQWNLRICTQSGGGYICREGPSVREAIAPERLARWLSHEPSIWTGLESVAKELEVPTGKGEIQTQLMGYRSPTVPFLFLTDQF
jgi:predicted acetyltransferase